MCRRLMQRCIRTPGIHVREGTAVQRFLGELMRVGNHPAFAQAAQGSRTGGPLRSQANGFAASRPGSNEADCRCWRHVVRLSFVTPTPGRTERYGLPLPRSRRHDPTRISASPDPSPGHDCLRLRRRSLERGRSRRHRASLDGGPRRARDAGAIAGWKVDRFRRAR